MYIYVYIQLSKHWRITNIAAANMAWTKWETLLKNHCRLQSNITQESPMVPTVKNMVRYVTRKAPTRSNNQRVRKKSESIKPQVKNGKCGWNLSVCYFFSHIKTLKNTHSERTAQLPYFKLVFLPTERIDKTETEHKYFVYMQNKNVTSGKAIMVQALTNRRVKLVYYGIIHSQASSPQLLSEHIVITFFQT